MAIPKYSCLGISSHSCIFRTTDASQCNTHLLSNSLYFSQNSLWNYIWLVLVKTWEMDLSFFPNLRWGYTYINSSRSLKVHSQLFLPNLYTIPKNAKEIGKMDWKHLPEKKKKGYICEPTFSDGELLSQCHHYILNAVAVLFLIIQKISF